ncbi:efflux RND transporter periplasmic adaptor subunit [Stieleria sp. TO1_6]|uniref:HlyD family secretion protein n=1 Tax=Stieleria tagensis TaxID=2956795 RepID=UPI00209B28D4|nr:efflux RND transporter periplasmic adaptor subunit [Stieleria tagensis]MCO8122476.1 efflux RND transporter periplasmic adaptor subunit [Stieleria tagensis]
MKQLIFASVFGVVGTGFLIVADQQLQTTAKSEWVAPIEQASPLANTVHAAGRIEGKTENILIRPQFPGRVNTVDVNRANRVQQGDILFRLEDRRYKAQRDLAAAALSSAQAKRMRLIEGARESEIAAAKHDMTAAETRFQTASHRLERATRLYKQNAISPQGLEDLHGEFETRRALLMAARERLETIKAAPRSADLAAADAAIAAAKAELQMAEIDLERCAVVSPCEAVVIAVEINPGEWASPDMPDAALELANIENLRVVADIDERDALRISTGQQCVVTADATADQSFQGIVTEIEPRMEPKKIYGGWAGERNETHTRRIWIDLKSDAQLPVGMPVEVQIVTESAAE